ncbi:S-adenosyl-L-methionine-dependent methyltransferase [Clohesyomyces aquaticus]|uniref:S-adenosyl-L-methionine-dependent methyltransferase n=1 Tax=Clohesyomyces aquaticus TaxID=1231657 RepID=A0A1Y1Z3D1_9PLEO|nr:S-adenosyl-L-methionine-dependent methyltransferase [Clohesyomyces aquaticus]
MDAEFGAAHFDRVASSYEATDATSKIARELLALAPPISAKSAVLDNACGPGIITSEIKKQSHSADARICAVDISPAMIEKVREKNLPGVEAGVMDAQNLNFANDIFTHSFTNMGIFLFPDPEKGAVEIYRTLKPGGIAVVTSIKQAGWIRIFQSAQRAVKPGVPLWNGMLLEEWSTKEKLQSVIEAGGFRKENIDFGTAGSVMPGSMMGSFLESIKDKATSMITEGWSKQEQDGFDVALQVELERTPSQSFEIETWVAVARK